MTPQAIQEITKCYDIITRQNYFTHNNDIVTQYDGRAMGAPSSGLIPEIFLQHTEQKHLPHITRKHKIINYCRYVDDILIIFYSSHNNIQQIVNNFNALHPNLHFTAEMEKDQSLNYLDVSIHRIPRHHHRHIQKTYVHKYHYPLQIQPLHTAQICHSQVFIQQTEYL